MGPPLRHSVDHMAPGSEVPSNFCISFSKIICDEVTRIRQVFLQLFLITLCLTAKGAGRWRCVSPANTERRDVTVGRWSLGCIVEVTCGWKTFHGPRRYQLNCM